MDLFQLKSNNKRKRENQDSFLPSPKRQHLAQVTTKIINLNDDCLLAIFEHLDDKSLFNVAVASEWLRPAAAYVYKRKFATNEIELTDCDDFHSDDNVPEIEDWGTYVTIRGLKTCLRFLRCFGSSISYLKIDYSNSKSERHAHLHHYISKYCANSLIRISFLNMPSTVSIDQFEFDQVFTNVKSVMLFDCDLGEKLPSIAKSFANLRKLQIHSVRLTDGFDQVCFPYLEHLCIRNLHANYFRSQNAANLLRSNRQIQCVEIAVHGQIKSLNAILNMVKENSNISKLVVEFCFVYDRFADGR